MHCSRETPLGNPELGRFRSIVPSNNSCLSVGRAPGGPGIQRLNAFAAFRALLVLLAVLLTMNYPSHAQSTQGSILGTVRDDSGAVVPGATVKLTNTDTGKIDHTATDAQGDYQILNLKPAHYEVEVAKDGFDTSIVQNLLLSARQQLRANTILKIGTVKQRVTVNASDAGVITTDTPTIAASLNSRDLINLPANVRAAGSTSPLNIIQALPGVQADSGSSPTFSIQGGIPSQSDTTIDGITAQDVLRNLPIADAFPSAESISELRVDGVSNNAEFGQPGELTSVTKSGTNQVHGALFWYFQNSGFDAIPFGSATKPKKVANDFGISAGGPVILPKLYNGHNKTFFFGTYEGFEFPQSETLQELVPTDLMKKGDFSQEVPPGQQLQNPFVPGTGYANNTLPSINPSAQALMSIFPSPNYGNLTSVTDAANSLGYNWVANQTANYESKQFDARIDQYFGSKALVFGRYTWKNINRASPNGLNVPVGSNFDQYRIFVGSFSYNFTPNLINEFRTGFTLQTYGSHTDFDGAAFVNKAGLENIGPHFPFNGITELDFNVLTSLGVDRMDETAGGRLYQYNDNLIWSKGSHTMKFGFDIKHLRAFAPTSFYGADNYGTFTFNGQFTGQEFADFELGLPNTSEVDDLPGQYVGQAEAYALYAQDNWKVTPNLTLVYGLRYELHPPYSDPGGDIGNFDPSVPLSGRVIYPYGKESILAPGFLADFNACPVKGVDNPYATGEPQNGAPCTPVVSNRDVGLPAGLRHYPKMRFAPRLGFAWRPFGNDSTAIRAGAGLYNITELGNGYYSMTAALQANTRIFQNQQTPAGPTFRWPSTNGGGTGLAPPTYGTAYFGTANSINWKDPYSMQWSLSVDRDLGKGIGVRVSYIGMKSDQLGWGPGVNEMSYSSTTPALRRPLSDHPFPNWGTVNVDANGAQANYHSLQVEASRHWSSGIQFTSTYTLAKNLADNAGSVPGGWANSNGGRSTYAYDRSLDYGNVYGTRRHRWLTTGVYDLPIGAGRTFGGGMNRVEDAIIGGWRISNIFLIQTGPWLTPYIPGRQADPSGTGSGIIDGRAQRPDRLGSGVPHGQNHHRWLDPSAFACPSNSGYTEDSFAGHPCRVGVSSAPIGRFGTSGVGIIAGPGTINLSSGLSKVFRVYDRMNLRMEGTFTNVLNHPNYGDPNINVTSGSFGKITGTDGSDFGGVRTGQVSVRLEF